MNDTELAEHAFRVGVAKLGIPTGTAEPQHIDLIEARRAFETATRADELMCDAWMGLAAVNVLEHQGTPKVVDRDIIAACYRTRKRLGENQRRVGLTPETALCGLYTAGPINLVLRTYDDLCLARAALLASDALYDDAAELIDHVKKNQQHNKTAATQIADYVLATIHMDTERWQDLLTALNSYDWETSGGYVDSVNYMAGTACAHLGMLIEAARRLDEVRSDHPDIYNKALLKRAYVAREMGDEDYARKLFEALRAHRSDPDLAVEAARALADSSVRLPIVTEEQISARTDPWDPTTAPTSGVAINDDRRGVLLKEAADELAQLIGLDSVKDSIEDVQANAAVVSKLREKGLPTGELTEHILLSGPPGTGKTVVARVLAKIYAGHGAVPTEKFIEATEEDLVSKYVAETREKTAKVIDKAQGGVLFIDEIYTLVKENREHNHGKEAIEGLLHRLENDRESFVCIVAGYETDINKFLRTNSGLRGRFTQRIRFRSYTPDELVEIADVIAKPAGAPLTNEARETLRKAFADICTETDEASNRPRIDALGNGRFVRQVIKHCATARNRRLVRTGVDLDRIDEYTELLSEDVHRGVTKAIETATEEAEEKARDDDTAGRFGDDET
ncbi:hypothetical protein EB73_03495 [Mycobacterium sp. SWH-M3]|nr:hypothetical protein EB73_03495 [Mycobacterium sp. SWH-M3]